MTNRDDLEFPSSPEDNELWRQVRAAEDDLQAALDRHIDTGAGYLQIALPKLHTWQDSAG